MSPPPSFELFALPPAARSAAAVLRGFSRGALLLLLVALVRASDPPLTPLALAEGLALFALAPELAARALLRAYAARAVVTGAQLMIERSDLALRIPLSSIASAHAALVPLPLPNLTLTLRSGARAPVRLALPNPHALLDALAGAGCEAARDALASLPVRFAAARAAFGRPWWTRWPARIAAFALLPGFVGFNAHQHIAFGALLGEYYVSGLRAWLLSASVHYATAALYLVLWSALWRAVCEGVALIGAQRSAASAVRTRGLGEHVTGAIYYASVPSMIALRFLA
ncbi:MAG: hypothetical protein FJ091_18190 [Deltaproteobacteria bacterium]|nr:hypothetical protein [Deltaproteobacteria bacterium]